MGTMSDIAVSGIDGQTTRATATASTGHEIVCDVRRGHVTLQGDLDAMQDVPEAEIDAVCAAAGCRCTWEPSSACSYGVESVVASGTDGRGQPWALVARGDTLTLDSEARADVAAWDEDALAGLAVSLVDLGADRLGSISAIHDAVCEAHAPARDWDWAAQGEVAVVSTSADLGTYLGHTRGDLDKATAVAVAERLRDGAHPAWGTDWSAWLAAAVDRAVAAEVAS